MIVAGLTGSIGMGKSTVAAMFADAGDAVHDADAAVHALYQGAAVGPVGEAFPEAIAGGRVDRKALSEAVLGDAAALKRLEAIVHPLVREAEAAALEEARRQGRRIAVIDVPLLLETGRHHDVDAVVVVSAPPQVQRARVLAREGMTADKLEAILSKQMPDREKRSRAHFVVGTAGTLESTRRQVAAVRRALLSLA